MQISAQIDTSELGGKFKPPKSTPKMTELKNQGLSGMSRVWDIIYHFSFYSSSPRLEIRPEVRARVATDCFQVLEVHLALEQLAELLAEIFEQLLLFVWNSAALKESIVYPYLKEFTV